MELFSRPEHIIQLARTQTQSVCKSLNLKGKQNKTEGRNTRQQTFFLDRLYPYALLPSYPGRDCESGVANHFPQETRNSLHCMVHLLENQNDKVSGLLLSPFHFFGIGKDPVNLS